MRRAWTALFDGGEMGARGVALVAVEAIGGELFVQMAEKPIAMDFCKN